MTEAIKVMDVGGYPPKVTFQTPDGRWFYFITTEEIAKEFGNHLYKPHEADLSQFAVIEFRKRKSKQS